MEASSIANLHFFSGWLGGTVFGGFMASNLGVKQGVGCPVQTIVRIILLCIGYSPHHSPPLPLLVVLFAFCKRHLEVIPWTGVWRLSATALRTEGSSSMDTRGELSLLWIGYSPHHLPLPPSVSSSVYLFGFGERQAPRGNPKVRGPPSIGYGVDRIRLVLCWHSRELSLLCIG